MHWLALQAIQNSVTIPGPILHHLQLVLFWADKQHACMSCCWLSDITAFHCWASYSVVLTDIQQLICIFTWAFVLYLQDASQEQFHVPVVRKGVHSTVLTAGQGREGGVSFQVPKMKELCFKKWDPTKTKVVHAVSFKKSLYKVTSNWVLHCQSSKPYSSCRSSVYYY